MSHTGSKGPITNMADLLRKLGNVSPRRVRLRPLPGRATEEDVVRAEEKENVLCELVDGVLVEKVMGYPESSLACELIFHLRSYLKEHNVGILGGESGATRLLPGLIRMPDVSFVSWERLKDPAAAAEPILGVAPDLAVEVLSKGNTRGEMRQKLKEYFLAGVRLVWYVDPKAKTVRVFAAPDVVTTLGESQTLDGGDVLPGFELSLKELFTLPAKPEQKVNGGKRA